MSEYINALQELLKILSSPAQEQLSYLNDLGDISLDELALEFDELFLLASTKLEAWELSQPQFKALNFLNSMLDKISNIDECWTKSSLSERREWEEIRKLSNVCLKEFK